MNVTSAGPARPISVRRAESEQRPSNAFGNSHSPQILPTLPLLAPVLFVQDERGGKLLLWLRVSGDEQFSFRQALALLESVLGPSTSHSLPPEFPMEDFLHGQFRWEGSEFALYFERSFGYLQFSSPSVCDVRRLETSLKAATEQILPERPNQATKRSIGLVVLGLALLAAPFLFLYLRP